MSRFLLTTFMSPSILLTQITSTRLVEINSSQEVNTNRINTNRVYFRDSPSHVGCKAIIVDSMNLYCLKRTDCF